MPQTIILPSFAAGELSPSLYARVDLAKYHSGAALLRNFFVDYRGGVSNRPGTQYISRCLTQTSPYRNRLIRFQFSTVQNYELVFGDQNMRVLMNGGLVLEPSKNITAATRANPCTVTSAGHGYANADWVYISGCSGMTQLNGNVYIIYNVTANTFDLSDLDGNPINSTAFGVYSGGGTVARIFTLTTPYAIQDLPLLKYSQSADVMTLTHPGYNARQLTRTQHWVWTLTTTTFTSNVDSPIGVVAVPKTAGTTVYQYVVTAIGNNGLTESLPSSPASSSSVQMSTTANSTNTISWNAVPDATLYKIYRTAENPGNSPPEGALYGYIGSTTPAVTNSFVDVNISPDFTNCPPQGNNPFSGNNNPFCSTYYQGRQVFGGTVNSVDQLNFSRPGDFLNMDYSTPSKDSDSITANIASQQVNAIKHLLPMQSLIVLTSGGAWRVDSGDQLKGITPSDFRATPQAYNGCSDLPPIVINYDILYVQARGAIVRDLSYNFYVNLYTGADITVLSNHLFYGRQITDWAYAEEPFKIVWCVRDDGVLLSLTFLKEQEVYAWSHHDTQGRFLSVDSIIEGNENAVYFIVERFINGKYIQFIERMASRQMNADSTKGIPADLSKAWFVDCGLQYPLNYPNFTISPQSAVAVPGIYGVQVINGGSGYVSPTVTDLSGSGATFSVTLGIGGSITSVTALTQGTNITNPNLVVNDSTGSGSVLQAIVQRNINMTSPSPQFFVGNIGQIVRINNGMGVVVKVPGDTTITVNMMQPMSSGLPAVADTWSITSPVTTITGLDHLNGETVSILADGNVEPQQVVVNGSVTLQQPATAIFVGLPYASQLQSLYIDIQGEPTIQSKRKKISQVWVRMQDSRGMKVGADFKTLREIKERTTQMMGQPILPFTGDEQVNLDPVYQMAGQICVQQDNPLPCTILGLIPQISVGDT